MTQQEHSGDITLEDLLALVEKAVGTIERLQAANDTLTERLRRQTAVAQEVTEELVNTATQIQALEQAAAALRKDAEWCRWFKGKYGGANFSTFYWHIEKEYRAEHPELSEPPETPAEETQGAEEGRELPAQSRNEPVNK